MGLIGACCASDIYTARESPAKDKQQTNEEPTNATNTYQSVFLPICLYSTALAVLPSPITYGEFAELSLFYRSSKNRLLRPLETALMMTAAHCVSRLPTKYRSLQGFLESVISIGSKFYLQYLAFLLISKTDHYLESPVVSEEMFPYRQSIFSRLKYSLRQIGRLVLFLLVMRSSIVKYKGETMIGLVDFLATLVVICMNRSIGLRRYLPMAMFCRTYMEWFLKSL